MQITSVYVHVIGLKCLYICNNYLFIQLELIGVNGAYKLKLEYNNVFMSETVVIVNNDIIVYCICIHEVT